MTFEGRLEFVRENLRDFSSGVNSSDNDPGMNSSKSPSSTATSSCMVYAESFDISSSLIFEVHDIIAPSEADRPERARKSFGSFCSGRRKAERDPGAEKGDVDSMVTRGELPGDMSKDCEG